MSEQLTERTVQDALYWPLHYSGYRYICPNFTPVHWWECDLFAITKAGYWVEFEIKLTMADFKKDADKQREKHFFDRDACKWAPVENQAKHDQLAASHEHGPSRFYYLAPTGMIDPAQLPKWAGLMEVNATPSNTYLHKKVSAPRLNMTPTPDKILKQVQEVFYWRYWTLRNSISAHSPSKATP